MASEEEWLQADPRLAAAFVVVTVVGFVVLGLSALFNVPQYVTALAVVLISTGVVGVAVASFMISRRHGIEVSRSIALAIKTAFRWILAFTP